MFSTGRSTEALGTGGPTVTLAVRADAGLNLGPEVLHESLDWPGSSVAKRADAADTTSSAFA